MIPFLIHGYVLKIMPLCKDYARNANVRNSNAVLLVPDHEVLNIEFWNVILIFAQSMYNYNNQKVQVPTNRNDG